MEIILKYCLLAYYAIYIIYNIFCLVNKTKYNKHIVTVLNGLIVLTLTIKIIVDFSIIDLILLIVWSISFISDILSIWLKRKYTKLKKKSKIYSDNGNIYLECSYKDIDCQELD